MKKKEEVFYSRALVPKYNTIYKVNPNATVVVFTLIGK